MKKSELRQIIKEEITNVLNESEEQTNIIDEVLKDEIFDIDKYEIVSFHHEDKDSIIEAVFDVNYNYTKERYFGLKVVFNFYYSIRGSYEPATWGHFGGDDAQYPEEEFIPEVKEIMYLEEDDKNGKIIKHELTEEQKKIAIPEVIKALKAHEEYITEELRNELKEY
tara:strand:+ start:816 stop:1316 length:501 start_codon:yes stop_codon:yes gene_type:complete